jgi:ATP-binding protein involved in chromosome partitioning
VVVTTPHKAAQQVAVRAAQMARKTNMRLLGVVENMSYLAREDGTREELFGSGGGEALSHEIDAPLLARIPFEARLAALADEGEPIVLVEPDAEVSRAVIGLAEAIVASRREQGVGIVKPLPLVSA